ncbi:MAG: methylated-DNA-[protein]-cysteine S-methyltransferase [Actinomycetota bacterium]|jgi:methylated-DNA-[protein]-cysteine S-methyltransferase|nr:methylated-DNA-[protein]-cysteine S-methyltransferase [Actinomycetota bacterium]
MTKTRYRVIDSPVGPLTLAGSDDDVLRHLRMDDQTHPPSDRESWVPDDGAFPKVVEQLEAYFAGELTEFDVAVDLSGTAFQKRVWAALVDIPYGRTASYGEVAAGIGQPGASRAVGLANGRNPVAIIVPCHRVIGSTGTLTGYGGGLHRKRLLLDLERQGPGLL